MIDNSSIQRTASLLQPVQPNERIAALDVIRGFALFGVLLAYTLWNLGNPPENTYSQTDRVLNRVLTALVDTKAYTLLATLFGLGFSIQLCRAEARGMNNVPVYCRRLLALFLIGLTHALLLRNGDILVPYATMGFVLLPFRNASNRTLLIAALIGLLFPYLAQSVWLLSGIPYPQRPETEGMSYLAGNFAWVRYWYTTGITFWPASLPMFLFGLYLGRQRFLENTGAHRKGLWGVLITGLFTAGIALAGTEFLNRTGAKLQSNFVWIVSGLIWSVQAWALAAFYAATLLLLMQKPDWQKLLAPIGTVGRMALTNYLLQATLIVPLCITFHLFDKVTPTIGLLLALGVWMLQVPASVWWLKRFQFGPAEWLWRRLTYGRAQPMRIVEAQAKAVST
jgi:uncharacterized protein